MISETNRVREKLHAIRKKLDGLMPRLKGEHRGEAIENNRKVIADAYLRGEGIEIGPLNRPLRLGRQVRVKFVDCFTPDQLVEKYPELQGLKIVLPDVIDDGQKLSKFQKESVDFVIANHLIEHCEDPIGTLGNFARVLRPGGILFMAIPDMRHTFDCHREITTFEHLERDHKEGPEGSRESHYKDYVRNVRLASGERLWKDERDYENQVAQYMTTEYSIHFHVWDPPAMFKFINGAIEKFNLPFEIRLFLSNHDEVVWILRKASHH